MKVKTLIREIKDSAFVSAAVSTFAMFVSVGYWYYRLSVKQTMIGYILTFALCFAICLAVGIKDEMQKK